MKWWKYILAFLITPLETQISFALWNGVVYEPWSLSGITSVLQSFVILTAPVSYVVALLFGVPAVLILSRKMRLTFPAIVIVGTLIGTITGLFMGFHIGGYDMSGMLEYFTFDLISIYTPSTISGMVCASMYWVIRTISVRDNKKKLTD